MRPNRSLSYLCRSFDQLNQSEDYQSVKPVIHIGFLDYTLFKDKPQFYATYKMMNTQNHHIYNDNFDLRVINLTQIELATDEDKQFQMTADELVRKRCRDREDYYSSLRSYERTVAQQAEENTRLTDENIRLTDKNVRQAERIAHQDKKIAHQDEEITLLKQRIAEIRVSAKFLTSPHFNIQHRRKLR